MLCFAAVAAMSDLQLCQGDGEKSQILAGTFIRLGARLYDWRSRPVVGAAQDGIGTRGLPACGRWLPLTSFAFTPVGDIGISLDE